MPIAVALTVANARRGPRIQKSSVDVVLASSTAGQRWTLVLDQPVVAASVVVNITPDVAHDVDVAGTHITVRLQRPLDLGTTYILRATVTGSATGAPASITERVTTPPAHTFLLHRADKFGSQALDTVLRTEVRTGAQEVVLQARGIEETASAPPYLAVAQQDPELKSGSLQVLKVGPGSGPDPSGVDAGLPAGGRAVYAQLHASGSGGIFGFVTIPLDIGNGLEDGLHVLDPVTGRHGVVVGPQGEPLVPQTWHFVPGTTQIVAQTLDNQVWLVDAWNKSPPRPLGAHNTVDGFVPGTRELLVEDQDTLLGLDLSSGRCRTATPPTRSDGFNVYESWEVAASEQRPMLSGTFARRSCCRALTRRGEGRTPARG